MIAVKTFAVVLHIITAAAFFGLGLPLARQARAFASSGATVLGEQGARSARLMTVFAALTFVFGVVAMFTPPGGMSFYGPEFHTSLTLILVLLAVHVLLVQRGWASLSAAVAGGGDTDGPRKRVAMGMGITHLLWLIILVLMFWSSPVAPRIGPLLAG